MTYVILDLEFNGAYSKKKQRFISEIIEFGAVKCDEKLNIIDTFSCLVTPQISKKLNSHVSKLTHIHMAELQESNNTFTQVLPRFQAFLGDSILMSWGTSDILVLAENYRYYYDEETMPFVSAYVNLQTFCERALEYHDASRQMGLSTCAGMLGIGYDEGELHRALTDAELTSLCFQKLYQRELFEPYIMPCDADFYKRITFKNYNICDPKSPEIDRHELYCECDRCGHRAWRRGKWKVKNKSFRANFRCLRCKHDFEGRITFKMTYDGIKVIRSTAELPDKNAQTAKPEQKATQPQKETQQKQNKGQKQPQQQKSAQPQKQNKGQKQPQPQKDALPQKPGKGQKPQQKQKQPQQKDPRQQKAPQQKSSPAPFEPQPIFLPSDNVTKPKLTDQFLSDD